MRIKNILLIFIILIISLSSCGVFRKGKRGCGDCPSWSYSKPDSAIKDNIYADLRK